MNLASEIAKQIREMHVGNNWTEVCLKDILQDVDCQEATTKIASFNTIAALVYHMNYYIERVSNVLDGKPLNAKDSDSFSHPPINAQKDWEQVIEKVLKDGKYFASQIEKMPEAALWEVMVDQKYGSYSRNFVGIIEHFYYHLGQVSLIKKMIRETNS